MFRDKSAKQRERGREREPGRERERLTEIGTEIERQKPNHVLENFRQPCVLMFPGLIGGNWPNLEEFSEAIGVKAFVFNLLCALLVSKAFGYTVDTLEESGRLSTMQPECFASRVVVRIWQLYL